MKQLLLFIALFTSLALSAQKTNQYLSTNADIDIISPNIADAKVRMSQFVKDNQIDIIYQKEYNSFTSYHFPVTEETWQSLESILPHLGLVSSLELTKENEQEAVDKIKLELDYLTEKRDSYATLLKEFDATSEKYMVYWKEMKDIEEKIFYLKKSLLSYQNSDNLYNIKITINDEVTTPDKTKIRFVNMPGAEYSYLTITNPTEGISAAHYDGYFLKYMFTRGKSFISLGAYNSTEAQQNDSTINEMFVFGFGQDFYSRYLGRGHRKCMNLYSGYTLGYILGTGEVTEYDLFFVSPSVGIELFKNRFLLIDTKANYFIPLNHNKELRGWSVNASVNFVF